MGNEIGCDFALRAGWEEPDLQRTALRRATQKKKQPTDKNDRKRLTKNLRCLRRLSPVHGGFSMFGLSDAILAQAFTARSPVNEAQARSHRYSP